MTITELKKVYGERIAQFELERKELSKKKVVVGWGRLLCFLMIPSAIYVFFPNWLLILPIVLPLRWICNPAAIRSTKLHYHLQNSC